ncbi:NADH-quinone oxidoreductase subunit C/D [termite gut metagenome]|uniref:NADH-quinone oxidoreductase subunit C/D n=1 Tax=termite gut metagenome TaxID=433724 RepID=A0A5J4RXG4_9ZZZZ
MNEIKEIAAKDFHEEALKLRRDKHLDFLENLIGMDWGETLGVIYYLESTVTKERMVIKISTPDRENPELPSVCDIWKAAGLKEREVYDFFGIRFINHPDMRRLYLRNDWVGYPLRKDDDPTDDRNPLRLDSEPTVDTTVELELNPDGTIQGKENFVFEGNSEIRNNFLSL